MSEDGLVYTYKLRDDAYFHNGRKMTADDIIWSFTRIMDGSKGYPGARYVRLIKGAIDVEKGQAKEISGLKKIDDFTLEMTLTDRVEPGYYFFDGTTAILPKEEVEKGNFATNPVGLGPFKFKEHIPGSRVVDRALRQVLQARQALRRQARSADHGRGRGARRRLPQQGDRHLDPRARAVRRLSRRSAALQGHPRSGRDVHAPHAASTSTIKPFDDKRVRQAINYAIDTDLIIKRLVKDKAYRAVSWLPLSSPAFDKTVKPYAYDPEKAKKLLAEAGYPNGFEFEWTTSQNESWGLPIVEAVIPMLAKVGIKVKPKLVEVTVLTDIAMKGEHPGLSSARA